MFEISALAAQDTFTLKLRGTDDQLLTRADGTPLTVTVYGPGSKAYAEAQAQRNQRLIDRMAESGRKARLSAAEQAAETAAFLAACTSSIDGWGYRGAADSAAITACYADPRMGWLTQQVDQAIGNWANFSSGSATS